MRGSPAPYPALKITSMAVGDLTAARHLARGPQATCGWRPDIKPRNGRRMCARDWRCQLSGSDDASCPGALVNAAMWSPGHSEVLKEIRIARYRALPGPTCSTPGLGCSQGAPLRKEDGHQSGIIWTEPTARTGDLHFTQHQSTVEFSVCRDEHAVAKS